MSRLESRPPADKLEVVDGQKLQLRSAARGSRASKPGQPSIQRYQADPATLEPASREAFEEIQRKRGVVSPIFRALIASPKVALKFEEISSLLWKGNLPESTLEVLFLVVARKFRCEEQWSRHEHKALAAGVPPACILAIERGLSPGGSAEVRVAWQIAKQLLSGRRVSAQVWSRANSVFGEAGVAEMVAFLGFASTVAMAILIQE